ncbi:beta strand repeat-containing protein [Shimia sp.]|uniref:beta strand repeat-containing protein n=1 Tax=Shimia sp. TaxID=1954381 RepID=UPI003BA8A166
MTEIFVEEALAEAAEVTLDQSGGEVVLVTIRPAVQQVTVGNVLLPNPADYVEPVNTAPVAGANAATTQEDRSVDIDLLGMSSDADGDPLTVTSVSSDFDDPSTADVVETEHGHLSLTGGTVEYTPDVNFGGVDEFEFTVSDGEDKAQGSVTVTVQPQNDAPTVQDDTVTTNEDTAVTIDALANDVDIDGDTLTIQSVTQPASGSVAIVANELVYTPAANAHGSFDFTYTASDGQGGASTATVSVTVAPVNDAPVAANDSLATPYETPLVFAASALLSNDSDLDGDSLSVVSVSSGVGGAVSLAAGNVTFTPTDGFSGVASFTYVLSDSNGGTETGSVTVTVGANTPPVANDDSATTNEDVAVTLSLIDNDTDLDGDTLTITTLGAASHGSVADNGDGSVTYTPNANFNGSDSFTYQISDGNGGTDSGSVSVNIAPVNDAPIAVNDATTTNEDTAVVINLLANDTDLDGDSLTISNIGPASNGTVVDSGNGTVTYTPVANYNGPDAFTYTLSDGKGGTDTASVSILVNAVNDDPSAAGDSASTNEDQSVTVDVTGNDSDPDGDSLTLQSVTQGGFGTVAIDAGQVTYTPDANANGQDTFTYTVVDGNGGTSTATVTIDVIPYNDAPVALADSFITPFETPVNIATSDLIANDTDVENDALSVAAVANPVGGTVALSGNTVTFTPATGFTGAASFEYTVADGFGGTDVGTVSVAVGANAPPVAVNDTASTAEDTAVSIAVLSNDSDLDGDTLSITSIGSASDGTVTDNGNGTVTYTPGLNFNGQDTFTYSLADGNGGTATATVTINVSAVNDAPVAANDGLTTAEDTPVSIDLLINDSDLDGDTVSVASIGDASNGAVVDNGDGTATYTPAANFNGADSFSYTIADGNGGSDTATVSITVTPVNDAPVAVNDAVTTNEDTAVTINLISNDTDAENDTLTVTAVGAASNGTVVNNGNGTVTYTPNANYNGADSFAYTVSDGNGGTDTGTVNITVSAVNDAPVGADDAGTVEQDNSITIDVLANDSDPENNVLSIDLSISSPSNGAVAISNGRIVYTPNAGFVGQDEFDYIVTDGSAQSVARVTVTVTAIPTQGGSAIGFDPSLYASGVAYTENNTVATNTDGSLHYPRVDTVSSNPKNYAEVRNTGPSTVFFAGLGTTSSPENGGGNGTQKSGWVDKNLRFSGGGSISMAAQVRVGDTIQIAWDSAAALLWMRKNGSGDWNNTPGADPATGVGGVDISGMNTAQLVPMVSLHSADEMTLAIASGDWAHAAPTGFTEVS